MNQKLMIGIVVLVIIALIVIVSYMSPVIPIFHAKTTLSTSATSIATTRPTTTTLTTSVVTTAIGNLPPQVKIISPKNLSTVNGNVTILANVTSSLTITHVQFLINSTLYATVNSAPYSYMWNTNGLKRPQYVITVRAYDSENDTGQANVLVDIGLVQHGK